MSITVISILFLEAGDYSIRKKIIVAVSHIPSVVLNIGSNLFSFFYVNIYY
jgi:hypothetical protein